MATQMSETNIETVRSCLVEILQEILYSEQNRIQKLKQNSRVSFSDHWYRTAEYQKKKTYGFGYVMFKNM